MLDTTNTYETPEGIELELNIAGAVVRSGAWLIDALLRFILYLVVATVFGIFGKAGDGIVLILFFLIEWFYPVFFELHSGATPGKKQFNLIVCHDNGTPIGWQASVTRNLLRVADFFPVMFGAGLVSMLLNKNSKRLGDIVAGTVVVYRQEVNANYNIKKTNPLALPAPLLLEEQRAVLDFAERANTFSSERREELAQLLTPYMYMPTPPYSNVLFAYATDILYGHHLATDKNIATDKNTLNPNGSPYTLSDNANKPASLPPTLPPNFTHTDNTNVNATHKQSSHHTHQVGNVQTDEATLSHKQGDV